MTSTAKSKENLFFKKFGRELVIRELCKCVFSLTEEEEAKLGWGGGCLGDSCSQGHVNNICPPTLQGVSACWISVTKKPSTGKLDLEIKVSSTRDLVRLDTNYLKNRK